MGLLKRPSLTSLVLRKSQGSTSELFGLSVPSQQISTSSHDIAVNSATPAPHTPPSYVGGRAVNEGTASADSGPNLDEHFASPPTSILRTSTNFASPVFVPKSFSLPINLSSLAQLNDDGEPFSGPGESDQATPRLEAATPKITLEPDAHDVSQSGDVATSGCNAAEHQITDTLPVGQRVGLGLLLPPHIAHRIQGGSLSPAPSILPGRISASSDDVEDHETTVTGDPTSHIRWLANLAATRASPTGEVHLSGQQAQNTTSLLDDGAGASVTRSLSVGGSLSTHQTSADLEQLVDFEPAKIAILHARRSPEIHSLQASHHGSTTSLSSHGTSTSYEFFRTHQTQDNDHDALVRYEATRSDDPGCTLIGGRLINIDGKPKCPRSPPASTSPGPHAPDDVNTQGHVARASDSSFAAGQARAVYHLDTSLLASPFNPPRFGRGEVSQAAKEMPVRAWRDERPVTKEEWTAERTFQERRLESERVARAQRITRLTSPPTHRRNATGGSDAHRLLGSSGAGQSLDAHRGPEPALAVQDNATLHSATVANPHLTRSASMFARSINLTRKAAKRLSLTASPDRIL
ncbi:uncharacterized protein L969DRAFT_97272 [Mixia osmundae IAM 14324]|uniref:Uncharacterized protein n=1 Tax=Mixia osmundae (strain CBS 9802 / IAM 14324 / JCM 22182 / KY 12970) TaxID=764103 RepID=G7DW75_MIXOS|nr:uncharacterized protein L969DRAFT_97272 [Mixia osmundae IAM 14324]KEI36534.1 hypothetical protein L969DRAFT_97272 [Mixia osmundae IAM 14324]GAA94763.1 hypothetical protein E5Q_01417 [Mixia osmundae IAM 14324]